MDDMVISSLSDDNEPVYVYRQASNFRRRSDLGKIYIA